jgi:hypothetical protein
LPCFSRSSTRSSAAFAASQGDGGRAVAGAALAADVDGGVPEDGEAAGEHARALDAHARSADSRREGLPLSVLRLIDPRDPLMVS